MRRCILFCPDLQVFQPKVLCVFAAQILFNRGTFFTITRIVPPTSDFVCYLPGCSFNDTTVKTQNQIKQFGFQKSQSFSTPWSQASVMLTGRFPEIAKRSQSQMSMQSMPSCKFSRLSSLNGLQVSADVSVDTITTNLPPL